MRWYLASQLERVDLLPLLAQRVVHAAQVVAHHAELVLVAPLGGGQLILPPGSHGEVMIGRWDTCVGWDMVSHYDVVPAVV